MKDDPGCGSRHYHEKVIARAVPLRRDIDSTLPRNQTATGTIQ